jgi:hypothetical protein
MVEKTESWKDMGQSGEGRKIHPNGHEGDPRRRGARKRPGLWMPFHHNGHEGKNKPRMQRGKIRPAETEKD